jgi:hypothetical protein
VRKTPVLYQPLEALPFLESLFSKKKWEMCSRGYGKRCLLKGTGFKARIFQGAAKALPFLCGFSAARKLEIVRRSPTGVILNYLVIWLGKAAGTEPPGAFWLMKQRGETLPAL